MTAFETKKIVDRVDCDYFEKFRPVEDRYLPVYGEGETMATQTVTAIVKLVYKWYNDGDVYDNRFMMEGWENDLSSYANWLYNNLGADILCDIGEARNDADYEQLLKKLADTYMTEERLFELNKKPAVGSIYTEEGVFEFEEYEEDWED